MGQSEQREQAAGPAAWNGGRGAPLAVATSGDHFTAGGRPEFYLADTAWSAFVTTTEDDWLAYLDLRRRQGFNAVQVSVLPILHDRGEFDDGARLPFATRDGGRFDYASPDPAYFTRAARMAEQAADHGLRPALTVLWCNYVPGTWASRDAPEAVMPEAEARDYVDLAVATFEGLDPLFAVSGDTDFAEPATVAAYAAALRQVKAAAPASLTTLHTAPHADLPAELAASPDLDLFAYQSGHLAEAQDLAWQLAGKYLATGIAKPIVNMEPCYEGHGHGFRHGRFGRADVRRATWHSLLAGAKAGVTYGAHGVWGWHRRGQPFLGTRFSGTPYDRRTALAFEGAWDVALARRLFDDHDLFDLAPRQDLLVDPPDGVRAAATPDLSKVVVYAPYPTEVTLAAAPAGRRAVLWDLERRDRHTPALARHGDGARLDLPDVTGDNLLVVT